MNETKLSIFRTTSDTENRLFSTGRAWHQGGSFILPLAAILLQIIFPPLISAVSAAEPDKTDSTKQAANIKRFEATEIRMAMPVRVVLYADSEESANRGFKTVFDKFTAMNKVLSDYQKDSELMQLCATAPHDKNRGKKVSDDLFAVLVYSQKLSEQSAGAFDITIGPLTKLWRKSKRSRELPSPETIAKASKHVGYKNVILNEKDHTVALTLAEMQLDAGGVAAGYTIDRALEELKKIGINSAMIDASGDIGCSDAPPNETGWRIGIAPLNPTAPPSRFLRVANAAITTSGDAYQHVTIAGQDYSHIIDPKTGLGLRRSVATTVLAKNCISADSLATTVCILGPERGLELIKKYPGSEAVILLAKEKPLTEKNSAKPENKIYDLKRDEDVEVFVSPGLEKWEEKPTLAE